jgi:hypothetical protein
MRRILVDAARARGARRRGGVVLKVNLDETALVSSTPDRSILALDDALPTFAEVAPQQAKGGRVTLLRRTDGRGNRRGFENLFANGQARLGPGQGLVITGNKVLELRELTGPER